MAEETADAKCQCSKTWVLVVHNDFLQIEGYERHGNDVDLENLRRVFQVERRCRFAELKNCDKEEILGTLSSEQKLIKMFHPDDDYDEKISTPEILYLFVLSHGESGGRILTDHFKIKPSKPSHFVLALETYNTSDIWNDLANLNFLKSCTKIICLAPCRGINPETKIDPDDDFTDIEGHKLVLPGVLTSNPNREDFIIFYATVENTYSNRNELRGTWFVQSICSVLDEVSDELDILMFFTRVQFKVCQMTKIGRTDVGQTPQLHFFSNNYFKICAPHSDIKYTNAIIRLKIKNVDLSDCQRISYNDDLVAEQSDAKGFNLLNLLQDERVLFYDWGQQHFNFSRGRALIFHDDQNLNHPLELATCFRGLDYNVKMSTVKNIKSVSTQKSLKQQFVSDGSLVVCILTHLVETDAGLALLNGGDCILLSAIVDEFSGPKCKHLIGKPKLFFLLDDGNKKDSTVPIQIYDAHQFNNSHAGVSVFLGVGTSLIEGLCLILNSEELRSGSKCLQSALVDLIRSTESMPPDRMCVIKPQFISTLPVLVDFPQLKPVMANKKRIFAMSGSFFLALMLTILFASVFWSNSPDEQKNTADLLDVDLQSNCSIKFLPTNTLSIGPEQWNFFSKKCKENWKVYEPESAIADLIVVGNVSEAVWKYIDASKEKRSAAQQLKLVVLFAYETVYLSKLGQFCFELNNMELRNQCFNDANKRISQLCGIERVEFLGFWYYYLQRDCLPLSALQYHNCTDLNQFFKNNSFVITEHNMHQQVQRNCLEAVQLKFPINLSYSVQEILALITFEIRPHGNNGIEFFEQFLKLGEVIKKFYLPIIASHYYDKGYDLNYLLTLLRNKKVSYLVRCAVFNELFAKLKNQRKLKTLEGLYLRAAIHIIVRDGNSNEANSDEINMCANVIQELLQYSADHRNVILTIFDENQNFKLLQLEHLTKFFIMDIIQLRYNYVNLNQLMNLLWGSLKKQLNSPKFGCNSSVYLLEEMRQHPAQLLSLTKCRWHKLCATLQRMCGGDLMCWFQFEGYPALQRNNLGASCVKKIDIYEI